MRQALLKTRPAESGFGSVRRGPLRWPATERHPEIRVRCADPPRSRRASVGPTAFGSPGGAGLRTEPDRSWMETMSVWPEAGTLQLAGDAPEPRGPHLRVRVSPARGPLSGGARVGSTRCPSGRRGRVAHRRPTPPLRWRSLRFGEGSVREVGVESRGPGRGAFGCRRLGAEARTTGACPRACSPGGAPGRDALFGA